MADATKTRRRRRAAEPTDEPDMDPTLEQSEDERGDEGRDTGGEDGSSSTLRSELVDAIREAAIEVLRPVAQKATKTAAKAVVTKGPDLVLDKVAPMLEDAGGAGGLAKDTLAKGGDLAGGLTDKLPGGGKGKKPTGHGRGRRLPVQEYVDVAVPIDVAYDQFTQFEEFPKFMHRVEKIEQRDDSTLMCHENIGGVRRSWEAEILEQQPCERIVWRSDDPQTVGVVTFHALSDRLTRVYINLDFQPKGLFEKTASGMRMSRRALRSDLMRFKAFVEMRDEPTGAWRGVIEDGEVSDAEDREGEDFEDQEDDEEAEPSKSRKERRFKRSRAESDEDEDEDEDDLEDEEEEEEEPVAEEDDEEEMSEEDEEEEKPKPKRKPSKPAARRRSAAATKKKTTARRG